MKRRHAGADCGGSNKTHGAMSREEENGLFLNVSCSLALVVIAGCDHLMWWAHIATCERAHVDVSR